MIILFSIGETIQLKTNPCDILTMGELLVDMISTKTQDGLIYKQCFGGSVANIAMNVKRLGAVPTIAACVGNDSLGRFCIDHIESRGILTNLIQKTKEPTSMVLVNKTNGTPTPIFYRGADRELKYTQALTQAIKQAKILHFSCWPISQPTSRQAIEKALDLAKQNGLLIGFDPNYHPGIWEDNHDGKDYVKSIISKVDIIKPSEDDAIRLFGEASPHEHIQKFLELGAKLVIMTLGEKGAIVCDGKTTMKFETKATHVEDTTGAGDAFWAGFYMGILKKRTVESAVNFGSAVSAYKLKFVGAVADLPTFQSFCESEEEQ